MPKVDLNPRNAGRTRVNAKSERARAKLAWRREKTPFDAPRDFSADTLVILLQAPAAPTSDHLRRAAVALGENAKFDLTESVFRDSAWELGVCWANRKYIAESNSGVDHGGWLSVEVLAAPQGCSDADRLGRVGKLLLALSLTAAVALVRPATADVRMLTPAVADLVAAGRAADAFGA